MPESRAHSRDFHVWYLQAGHLKYPPLGQTLGSPHSADAIALVLIRPTLAKGRLREYIC